MKQIKFDLQLKGVRVTNLEELQDNFNAEILSTFQSGKLARWFKSREMPEQVLAVEAINKNGNKLEQMKGICQILELDADEEELQYMLRELDADEEELQYLLREQVINKLLNLRNNRDGFTINIEFIDNSNEYNTKFIYFMNMLLTLKPVKNPTKESGIYITAIDYSSGKREIMDTSFIWPKSPMSVKDAYEKLGLADTQEEAYALGNTKKIMESKVLEQKQKLARLTFPRKIVFHGSL